MGPIRARVKNGKLIVDEPTLLPEGTVLDLVIDDEGDDLSSDERKALHAALEKASRSIESGKAIPADDVIRELRDR
jgi:hypothetical protein